MLTLEQLEARKTTIGASDLAPILGISPFKNIHQLYDEKVHGKSHFYSKAMDRGNRLEPRAREIFCEKTGIKMNECETFAHPDRFWQTATPDGLDDARSLILEIKCNSKERHEQANQGIIPVYYLSQIQQQMEVLSIDRAMYFSCFALDDEIVDTTMIEVKRDMAFMEEATSKSYSFWKNIMDRTPPEGYQSVEEIMEVQDPEWELLVDRWQRACAAEAEKELIKEEMLRYTNGRPAKGCGLSLTQCSRKGTVDYSKIPEIRGVDLERYRKQATTYWKIG